MSLRGLFTVSLAAKCRILFGWAVLLIIATALFFPWYYMERFVDELNLRETRHFALLARGYLQPAQPDWDNQHRLLAQWWTANADTMQLPSSVPQFVRIPRNTQEAAALGDPFLVRAIEAFNAKEEPSEYHVTENARGGQSLYRFALAVRAAIPPLTRPALVGLVAVTLPSHESDAQLWLSRIVIVAAGALAGFLAVLVFYLITHKLILSPIRGLKVVVEKVAAGDLTVRSDVKTGDEFEQLAVAINDMLQHLQKSQEELETINRSLDTRLDELAQANVALFEANKIKSEFLANVSHELRTPLTSIIGFAELLRDAAHDSVEAASGRDPVGGASGRDPQRETPGRDPDQAGAARVARFAHNILTSGRNLLDLINDLLDLAKMEAGKMVLHRTHFALRDICDAVIDFTRPLVEKKELRFDAAIADDLPLMHSDAGRIQQVLYNLLSNAIKFTPPAGSVRLDVSRQGEDRICLLVADTGPGIPQAQQAAVFEKFRQIDSSVTREHDGTGLGLPISRELTHMLGGTICLDSEPGKGTTFTVILPTECPETAKVPLVPLT